MYPRIEGGVSISQHDWSLHRKGPIDQARHQEKVQEAIRERLPELVGGLDIITSDGSQIVKVPIKGLDLPHFKYNDQKKEQVGQGDGQSGNGSDSSANGSGRKAGNEPGVDYYEAEITVDEIVAMAFKDLGFPNIEKKTQRNITTTSDVYTDIRRHGIMGNLDKKRTIMANMKRNAMETGKAKFGGVSKDDMRYRVSQQVPKPESNAVVVAMRDASASMGEFEKYASRTFYAWMVRFLKEHYENVNIVFITHHTEARVSDEEEFFKLGESGGTRVSSAYDLALNTLEEKYDKSKWNRYAIHFSDGDNWEDDNQRALTLATKLTEECNMFGYGEINKGSSRNHLMDVFAPLAGKDSFTPMEIKDNKDIFGSLKRFFRGERTLEEVISRA